MNLPTLLKSWRSRAGLTQRKAALRLGVKFDTYRGWEIGHRRPQGIGLAAVLAKIKWK